MDGDDDTERATYSSPPCFMHELNGEGAAPAGAWPEVARWRKAERERLIAARLAIPADERATMARGIAAGLDSVIGDVKGRTVGLYWPFRGEPDLRFWIEAIGRRGGRAALPLVVEKAKPLVFRSYRPGDRLERGVWNIPVPAEGEETIPDIVVSPVVGFAASYRLGYGGGFYDRTLASLPRRPLVVGIGYAMQRIATIYPQPHDIPMDMIVTEGGVTKS